MLHLLLSHDICRIVGGTIVNNEDIKIIVEGKNAVYEQGDIFPLVIGWYDDDVFQVAI